MSRPRPPSPCSSSSPISWTRPSRVLRRRVNTASAQPLLENTAAAVWSLDPAAPLVRIRLEIDVEGAHPHEATVFLKNPALAGKFGT